jgi:hypothetical protein
MNKKEVALSEKLFSKKYEQLSDHEKHVAHHLAERTHIARNVTQDISEKMTFGRLWRLLDLYLDLWCCHVYLGSPEFVYSHQVQQCGIRSLSVYSSESVFINACRYSSSDNPDVSKPPGL